MDYRYTLDECAHNTEVHLYFSNFTKYTDRIKEVLICM